MSRKQLAAILFWKGVDDISTSLAEFSTFVGSRFDEVALRVDKVEQRISRMEARFEDRFDSIEQRLKAP